MEAVHEERPTETLQRFVDRVEELRGRRLIRNKDLRLSFQIGAQQGGAVESSHHEPDEEDLRSFLIDFRKFVSAGEPVFAYRIFNIAQRHITDAELVEALAQARATWKKNLQQGAIGFIVNEERLAPEQVMDLFINGWYFHDDPEKSRQLEQLGELPMTQWIFLDCLVTSTNVIFFAGDAISHALSEGKVSDTPVRWTTKNE